MKQSADTLIDRYPLPYSSVRQMAYYDYETAHEHSNPITKYPYNFDPLGQNWGLQGYTLFFLFLLKT